MTITQPAAAATAATTTTATCTPTSAESRIISAIFNQTDPTESGFVHGAAVLPIFNSSQLADEVLADIWDCADAEGAGRLSRTDVAVAVRLIGWAQKGTKVSRDLIEHGAFFFFSFWRV